MYRVSENVRKSDGSDSLKLGVRNTDETFPSFSTINSEFLILSKFFYFQKHQPLCLLY